MVKDYDKLDKVIVHNQEEMDDIPLSYRGRIYIESTLGVRISNKYFWAVVARGNSSVEAWDNSSVEAWENSSVERNANSQVLDCQINGRILVSGNSRGVHLPKTIDEYLSFHGIKHTKTKAIFYKAVHKAEGIYISDHDSDFVYSIGEEKTEICDTNTEVECSHGIHISYLAWALDFGSGWTDFAILEVETNISDVILPNNSDGKVRTSKIRVLREIPLEECGIYGKILARRREKGCS